MELIVRKQKTIIAFSILSMLIFAILIVMFPESAVLILVCAIFTLLIGYCVQDIENHVFLFCFLVCFFTYLLSGQILNRAWNVYDYGFSNDIEMHTDVSLLMSLLGLLFGYALSRKIIISIKSKMNKQPIQLDYNSALNLSIQRIAKYIFYLTYVFWVLTLLDKVVYVYRFGYMSYYINYQPSVNALIRAVGSAAPSAFCLFLATMPSKREIRIPLFLYLLYILLSLGTGRRIFFMTGVVFLFAYFMCRNTFNTGIKPWISRKAMITVIVSIPLLITAMYFYEYIRSDFYVGNSNDYSPFVGFFVRQGTSINVIKYAEKYKDGLDPTARYSLFSTIRWLQNSYLNQFLGLNLNFAFGGQTQMTALHGTNLADYVSYKAMPYSYLHGGGWGSCYIAELYADYGYSGIFFGSFLYGVLLDGILKGIRQQKNIWTTALGLLIVSSLFKAPRASFDDFLTNFLYFYNWIIIPIVFILVKLNFRLKHRATQERMIDS